MNTSGRLLLAFATKTAADVFDTPWWREAATGHQSFRPPRFFSALSFGTISGAGSRSGSSIRGGSPAENLCLLSGSTHTLVASNCAEGPASARRGRRNGGEPRNSASGPRVISLDQADGSSRALLQVALVSVHREAVAPSLRAQAGALVWAPVGARCWAQSRRRFDPQPAQDVRYCHGGRG